MSKSKTVYQCQNCGSQFPKWQGQCSDCQQWNTLVEEVVTTASTHRGRGGYAGSESKLTQLGKVDLQQTPRLNTGFSELNQVLGGGLVADSVVLLGGDPGIGKSTLLLQVLNHFENQACLYVTGEESPQQLRLRAERLHLKLAELPLLAETQVEKILTVAETVKPRVMIIDSIQTVFTEQITSAPGSVSQVRESAAQLVRYAKQRGVALFIVGHVTKEGALAGPRVLEHMVDTVLYFEGDSNSRFRLIRAVKNRFGAANELGVFAMTDTGLKPVSNPSAIFLVRSEKNIPGSIVMVTWEGTRPLLVEVQALADDTVLANPRRVTVGLDHNRLVMLLAVLHRHAGISSHEYDVFANVVGGLRISETGVDLAVMLAVISSIKNKPLPMDCCVFGEVGLSGEIRPVPNGQERLREAEKHGFKTAIVPKANKLKTSGNIQVVSVDTLQEAIEQLRAQCENCENPLRSTARYVKKPPRFN